MSEEKKPYAGLASEIKRSLDAKGEWLGKIPLDLIQGISPYNARKHRIEENIEELENAIGLTSEVRDSITLNQDFQVVKGQRRFIVAKRWNFKEVPVIVRNYPDKLLELLDSRNENQLTYPLCSDDEADVIYTLAKAWGEEKTAQYIGRSLSYVSNIVRFREAPPPIKEAFEGEAARVKRMSLPVFRKILEEKGVEATMEIAEEYKKLPDLDKDQFIKDFKAGLLDTIDLSGRVKKAEESKKRKKGKIPTYQLLTLRLHKKVISGLIKIARKMKKDKQDLINDILEQWLEEHQGLVEI